ncbi:hypothetical protein Xcel_2790 [Xylanimonas cellulosilytica DSM 15894]|uniref:Membrane lipoprotein n=1 Tax=Xylanimonas cellulosilytica (strain DSM 15894 / JCM 12276 / CECT 5975 / KCTC 9989 / LMG 20990 / NBRC 107835 / XIL07) TaxID=446471 RepID=D1BYD2_XYLCX|nr:hypothetical protein [Xylanimonas cellulosilytica]ACZ31804.1 hypothetical protein Xcel_2790 [Xylanimonas cellulosilytica DSM 15894]
MTRDRAVPRLLAPAALASAALTLTACAGLTGGAANPSPASVAAIEAYTGSVGIAPDLVYVTDVDGFELATQSVGVMGDDGMSAWYIRTSDDGVATIMLTTRRGEADPAVPGCDALPDDASAELRCGVQHGEAHIQVEGTGTDAATVRAAAAAVRVPTTDELSHLFEELPAPSGPIERGDLPPGDGAPDNSVGVGG